MSKSKNFKILIANRTEIALRIQHTCNKMRIPCAITISEADKDASFAKAANEKAFIKGFAAKDSYLNIKSILEAAKRHKCTAIHPGYGFLSENAEFANKVIKAGLIFIGPKPECISALGDKARARQVADKCKVPVTPGTKPGLSDKEVTKIANKIGYPLLIKAVAGGGGRGMRVVQNEGELKESLPLARAEALKNFLDERIYLEKYINKPRHVEVQVLGDNYGNYLHFGTRDCSTQRRHQKLIEEAPAPYLSPKLREKLHQAALKIASHVGYNSVGTAEFLVSGEKFYFLEMNTRIQVEHPVTEEVTGFDLISLQIETAMNAELKIKQKDIKFLTHSIEYRINAEDPLENFKPLIGNITKLSLKPGKNVRIESGFKSGDEISPYYDGLIAKIIVNGKNRREALLNSKHYLENVEMEGIKTTLDFHRWALSQDIFLNSTFDIAYIGREFKPSFLLENEARKLLDEKHKGGAFKETLFYKSEKSGKSFKINVIHLNDKTFLFVPLDSKDKPMKEAFCRRSNSYNAAFESLKSEVLEKTARQKV